MLGEINMTGLDRNLLLLIVACGLASLGVSFLAVQRHEPPENILADSPFAPSLSTEIRWTSSMGMVLLSGPESTKTGWRPTASIWSRPTGRSPLFLGEQRKGPSPLLVLPKPHLAGNLELRFRGYPR